MASIDIVRLSFTSPLHISNERSDYSSGMPAMASDALSAAIYHAWFKMGYPEWIPKNEADINTVIFSSLFPYTMYEGQYVYFLPKPFIPSVRSQENLTNTRLRKKLKKITWLDLQVFKDTLNGTSINLHADNLLGNYQSSLPIGRSNTGGKSARPFISSNTVPRARVSRTGLEDSVIYYIQRYYFNSSAGLYTMVYYSNEEQKKRVQAAFRFLGEEGIGTDRNIGHGKFIPEFGDVIKIELSEKPEYGIALGLFCPENEIQLKSMLEGEKVGFDFIKRGGWLSEPYNTWRKKNIFMFKEGSCMNLSSVNLINGLAHAGRNIDIRPTETNPSITHPVWRNGRCLFFPFN